MTLTTTATPLTPSFPTPTTTQKTQKEPPQIQTIITTLSMLPHIEGGYYTETDRSPLQIPSPFPLFPSSTTTSPPIHRPGFDPLLRNASTTIFYLLTPSSPQGNFHRNRARTIHTLHRGRGRYVLIHADEAGSDEKRVEDFVVGLDVAGGEKAQWIVEGGKYKASFLLPDREGEGEGEGEGWLLISETVVPGFEFFDHDFLTKSGLRELVGGAKAEELDWLARRE